MTTDDTIWMTESPFRTCEGEILSFSVTFSGASSVTSPAMAVYSKSTDKTTTLVPSNAPTASGNIVSLSPIQIPASPDKEYVLCVTAVVDGNTEIRKCLFICQKKEDSQ